MIEVMPRSASEDSVSHNYIMQKLCQKRNLNGVRMAFNLCDKRPLIVTSDFAG